MCHLKVGDLFEGCNYHPHYCTEVDGDDIYGISLLDGSYYSGSLKHCGIIKLTLEQVLHCREVGIEKYVKEREKEEEEEWKIYVAEEKEKNS